MIVVMVVARMAALRMLVGHDASPRRLLLSNADLALFTTDECRDMSDLVRRQAGNRCHVAELPVVGAHTVRYRWFDPEGNLYLDSGPVALNPGGEYRPRATVSASMPIAGAPAAWLPGEWKVAVEYDGEPLTTQRFDLEER